MAHTIPGWDSRTCVLLVAGVLSTASLPAIADDLFLKMDGIRGESIDVRHKGEMEILSYTQSMAGPFARGATGAGAAAGKAVCGMVTITKYVDLASPDLVLSALNGKHIPKAVIAFRKPGQQFEYYTVTLDDVIVSEIEQTDSKTQPRATEKVTLMGRRFRYEYTAQTPQGGTGGRPMAGWDCVAASKA